MMALWILPQRERGQLRDGPRNSRYRCDHDVAAKKRTGKEKMLSYLVHNQMKRKSLYWPLSETLEGRKNDEQKASEIGKTACKKGVPLGQSPSLCLTALWTQSYIGRHVSFLLERRITYLLYHVDQRSKARTRP